MKWSLSCAYWTLLLISVTSSGLLFIIVASEGLKGSRDASPAHNKPQVAVSDNSTINASDGQDSDQPTAFPTKIEAQETISGSMNSDGKIKGAPTGTASDSEQATNVNTAGKLPGLELFVEGLIQQPNLSQGVPETDQAVVLTLVDAAAAELQNLAEPRVSLDNRGSKSIVGNLTLTLNSAASVSEPTQLPSPSRLPVLANIEPNNDLDIVQNLTTKDEDHQHQILEEPDTDEPDHDDDSVVIVRADQTVAGADVPSYVAVNKDDGVPLELPRSGDGLETTSQLSEIEARARLTGGVADDGGVMLDVLVTTTGTDPHEDIPSFSEWAQKRLEEAEKKKTHPNASAQNPGGPGGRGLGSTKIRSKNYASPDCGSKIVAANPEAGSASSVLSSSRDEYMLNTCTSRVWFVVELCEAIQAEKIELANFELFSSSPRDFSVFVGDRFPSRDWSAVGQFAAKDERDIQSFGLHPRLFGKFVKVELHSHYGSEHFCPISLFRVYGTSEFEVLETENQIQESLGDDDDEDEEEMLDVDTGDSPRNLFGSARDAVLSIVKKAAEVLVKSGDTFHNNTKVRASIEDTILQNSLIAACITPRYTVLCNDCTETMYANVFQLVSCNDHYLASLLRLDFLNKTFCHSDVCRLHGFRIGGSQELDDIQVTKNVPGARFLTSLFPPQYLVALCNVIATRDSRITLNTSYYVTGNNSEGTATLEDALIAPPQGVPTNYESSTPSVSPQGTYCTSDGNSLPCRAGATAEQHKSGIQFSTPVPNDIAPSSDTIASLIKPTKTLAKDEGSRKEASSAPLLEPSRRSTEESTPFEAPATLSPLPDQHAATVDNNIEDPGIQGTAFETAAHSLTTASSTESIQVELGEVSGDIGPVEILVLDSDSETAEPERDQEAKISAQDQLSLDSLLSDLKDLEADSVTMQNNPAVPSSATMSQPSSTPQQKESVFLRLSNRIKTLERNMSLSGQYLEELSRRYKKQVEEMQRSLERALTALGEESRRSDEREARRLEEILGLKEQASNLAKSLSTILSDRDSWRSKLSLIGQHLVLMCIEIVIVLLVLSYCRRSGDLDDDLEGSVEPEVTRRKSVEGTNSCVTKKTKIRRPSEIASLIRGTYHELLIDDPIVSNEIVRKERKRKKKRNSLGKVPIVTISKFPIVRPACRETLNTVPGGTNLPSRRASSSDAMKYSTKNLAAAEIHQRPESAPENCSGWFHDQKQPENPPAAMADGATIPPLSPDESSDLHNYGVEDITDLKPSNELATTKVDNKVDSERKTSTSGKLGGILKNRGLSSPGFMKTALGSRSRRLSGNSNSSTEPLPLLKSDNWEWYSRNSGSRSSQEDKESNTIRIGATESLNGLSRTNGKYEDSDDSRCSSATPTSESRKNKKTYGLKKMVKKLF